MSDLLKPKRCRLCDETGDIPSTGFRQIYRQVGRATLYLPWWSCPHCNGWFVYPVPTPEAIVRNCVKATYNDPSHAAEIGISKQALQKRILAYLLKLRRSGSLLDFGCSFGEFLTAARDAGWIPSGFDPHEPAVMAASRKGFDVRVGWELHEAHFSEKNFSAITAVDSFCFAWNPYETLQTFYRLLEPGGVLAMRISNKRTVAGVAQALSPAGSTRDMRLSRILQGQFHTISIHRLVSILRRLGFERVKIEPWAPTISWRGMSVTARLAYLPPQVLYVLTCGKVNLSPGVLLFAQKAA